MENIVAILHSLISHAHGQGMPAARVAELHDLADKVAPLAEDAEKVAADVAAVTEVPAGGTPAA